MTITNFTYDEIDINQTAEIIKTVTFEDIQLFAHISTDINPAHLDEAYATTSRMKQIVAHGMLSGAYISAILGTILPGPGTIYLGQSLKFKAPVYINDTLNVKVTVQQKLPRNKIILDCVCTNQNGQITTIGEAEVLAPSEKLTLKKPNLPQISLIN